jgi:hypothetical protein
VRIPLFGRSYNISGVAGGEANLNSVGILNSDWGCGVIDSQFACSGSIPMKIGQETAISFRAVNFVGEIPKFIEANLYDAYDNKVLSIGIERTALIDESPVKTNQPVGEEFFYIPSGSDKPDVQYRTIPQNVTPDSG